MNFLGGSCIYICMFTNCILENEMEFVCAEPRDDEGRRACSSSPERKTTHLAVAIKPQYPGQKGIDTNMIKEMKVSCLQAKLIF